MRVGIITFSQIATLLIVLSLGLPISSEAGVFWADDFENHLTPNWDTGACSKTQPGPQDGCNPGVSNAIASSGTHSFLSHFPNQIGQAGTYINRSIPPSTDVWLRWHEYTVNFIYDNQPTQGTATKSLILVSENGVSSSPSIYIYHFFGSTETGINVSSNFSRFCSSTNRLDSACNMFPNVAAVPIQNNQWYCLEAHVVRGTPGQNDAVVELFVNSTRTLYYPGLPSISNNSNDRFSLLKNYAQFGFGDRYMDDLAVGDTRIGCGASDSTPPATPSGLIIR